MNELASEINNTKTNITTLKGKPDEWLFYVAVLLISCSVMASYSLSAYVVEMYNYSQFHFFVRQFISAILAISIMWLFSKIDSNSSLAPIGFFILFISLMAIVSMYFLPNSIVSEIGGARRWIQVPGFSIAPTEFFKVGFVFFLAWSFQRKLVDEKHISVIKELTLIMPYILLFGVLVFLIGILQNDLGQLVLLAIVLCFMFIFAGRSFKLIAMIFAVVGLLATMLIVTSPHRIMRIKSWWANIQDFVLSFLPADMAAALRVENLPEPYQIYHTTNAFVNGGFFGTGAGEGFIKLGFLSEVHTDIALAGFTEEFGFIGLLFLLLCFMFLIYRIFKIINNISNPLQILFCVGVVILISFSLIINAFGLSGLIPLKGIAVPFVSYGGSSMVANAIAIGLVLSISKNTITKQKE